MTSPETASNDEQGSGAERPSKTALKRMAHDQQALGEALAALPDARLAALDMPDALRDAILEYRRTKSHEGRRRQRQHIGKLMRQADTAPLQEAVAQAQLGPAQDALALHKAERWRVELVANDQAMTQWLSEFPASDAQRLRALIRNARKDEATPVGQRHGRAWRELFQFIKQAQDRSDEP
jgi:ribosome-associated protein